MYLFTRSARLAPGKLEKSMAWAFQITEKVNQISELDFNLWTRVFSPGSGTLVWTATVEDLSVLEATEAKLGADSGYLSLVDTGASLGSDDAIDDGLLQFVHADPSAAGIQPQYANVVEAVMAPGSSGRGIELGVEIAQRAGRIVGCPTSFGVAATGVYGAVEWITLFDSVQQLQRGQEALANDADFTQTIDKEASKVYLANAMQTTYRRLC
jgi:hypothetical protein